MSLSEVIKGKVVTIQVLSLDPITPNQAVGQVFLDGTDIAEIMVSRGYAWVSSADPVNPKLKALELEAKAQKRGLWGMPEYAKRAPSDVVEEILPPPDTFGLLIYIFLGSIKGWRLALSLLVTILTVLVPAHIWRSSRRLVLPAELLMRAKRQSIATAVMLVLLSAAVGTLYLILTNSIDWRAARTPEEDLAAIWSTFSLILAFIPPIVAATLLFVILIVMVSQQGGQYRKLANRMGYAGVLGANIGAYLYTIDQMSWQGLGDYLLFGPFLLWPGIFSYALICTFAAALVGYLTCRIKVSPD